jgi:hypothetical protein
MLLPSGLSPVTLPLLVAHIAAGFVAFVVAPGALATRPGSRWHRRWGATYFWSMAVVAATALPIAVLRPNLFLFLVAIFSFYLAFVGRRVLRRKRPDRGDAPTALDWAGVALVGAAGVVLGGYGAYGLLAAHEKFGVVAVVFGVVALRLAVRDRRDFLHPPADRKAWLYSHIANMMAAYIATVTAFSAVNLHALPVVVRWLWPTAVGVPFLLQRIRRERRRGASAATAAPRVAAEAGTVA